ncbi:ABC transporter permease [Candidatus Atribacteria bacterium 1244-E10-H5-B2]|nr:MAG: ABC transporter permease [Candidatus Atribacteria bacterium 1244-E10-H5-B2]
MINYILRRILIGLIVIIGVIVITFFLTRVVPSDPARKWAGPRATPEQIQKARVELGLDKSLVKQLGKYFQDLSHANLGYSLRTKQSITKELIEYLPATLELILLPTFIAVFIGILLGITSANKKDHWIDHISRFFSVGAISLPIFWVALSLQLFFYSGLGILPLGGRLSLEIQIFYEIKRVTGFLLIDSLLAGNFVVFIDALKHLVLPGITIALFPLGLTARMTRSALLEILNEVHILPSLR